MDFFATAAKGTEPALKGELRALKIPGIRADRGGVHFAGEWDAALRACLWSRVALRVLVRLATFEAPTADALYAGVRAIDWQKWASPRHTIAVRATGRAPGLTHAGFVAQKTKDAIVDRIRDEAGARPSVDVDDPDVQIAVHLAKGRAEIHLDLAGESLHRRGWRSEALEAPIKETLAAAVLFFAEAGRPLPLVDPMCGSGTIAIEAALLRAKVAPGLSRARFGLERWASFDASLAGTLATLRAEARAARTEDDPHVFGSDVDPAAIELARRNARAAGVRVRFLVKPISEIAPTDPPGIVVTNPPYGERLAGDEALYREMSAALMKLHGHDVHILGGSRDIEPAFRLTPLRRHALWNGPIECRLLSYKIP